MRNTNLSFWESKRVRVREGFSSFSNHIKDSRLPTYVRKAIRNYRLRDDILARKAVHAMMKAHERQDCGKLPSAQELKFLAEKPVVKAILPKVPTHISKQHMENLMKAINVGRVTLKYYAGKIQEADKLGQPLKLTAAQKDELNKAESLLVYYTFKPNVSRSSFWHKPRL
jgi:hypothetical protein